MTNALSESLLQGTMSQCVYREVFGLRVKLFRLILRVKHETKYHDQCYCSMMQLLFYGRELCTISNRKITCIDYGYRILFPYLEFNFEAKINRGSRL